MTQCKIILAPMQGWADEVMRDLLTRIGGLDEVVSEFVRVTHYVHSQQTWQKYIPEMNNKMKTYSGVSCRMQLLGSDVESLVANACYAAELGIKNIDLNFGCPAATVNKHHGGAYLLQYPEHIFQIISSLRRHLTNDIDLTAKMRLGYEDTHYTIDCAQAIATGGASVLTVHARTKIQAYQPPALWEWFPLIQDKINIPVYANGDIFTVTDFIRLHDYYEPKGIMLGRGILKNPYLAQEIKYFLNHGIFAEEATWEQVINEIHLFFSLCQEKAQDKYPVSRLKQWLGMLKLNYTEADDLFERIKKLSNIQEIETMLRLNNV